MHNDGPRSNNSARRAGLGQSTGAAGGVSTTAGMWNSMRGQFLVYLKFKPCVCNAVWVGEVESSREI